MTLASGGINDMNVEAAYAMIRIYVYAVSTRIYFTWMGKLITRVTYS